MWIRISRSVSRSAWKAALGGLSHQAQPSLDMSDAPVMIIFDLFHADYVESLTG